MQFVSFQPLIWMTLRDHLLCARYFRGAPQNDPGLQGGCGDTVHCFICDRIQGSKWRWQIRGAVRFPWGGWGRGHWRVDITWVLKREQKFASQTNGEAILTENDSLGAKERHVSVMVRGFSLGGRRYLWRHDPSPWGWLGSGVWTPQATMRRWF